MAEKSLYDWLRLTLRTSTFFGNCSKFPTLIPSAVLISSPSIFLEPIELPSGVYHSVISGNLSNLVSCFFLEVSRGLVMNRYQCWVVNITKAPIVFVCFFNKNYHMVFDSKLQKSSPKLWNMQLYFPVLTKQSPRRHFSKYTPNTQFSCVYQVLAQYSLHSILFLCSKSVRNTS